METPEIRKRSPMEKAVRAVVISGAIIGAVSQIGRSIRTVAGWVSDSKPDATEPSLPKPSPYDAVMKDLRENRGEALRKGGVGVVWARLPDGKIQVCDDTPIGWQCAEGEGKITAREGFILQGHRVPPAQPESSFDF